MDFIAAIEAATGREAIRNPMPMQAGDVPATWADAALLTRLMGYTPRTTVREEWRGSWSGTGGATAFERRGRPVAPGYS